MNPMSYDPGVTPDWSFLPFMSTLQRLVGSTVAIGLIGLVGAHRVSQYSKWATFGSVGLAMVVGGISGLVRWGAGIGAGW